MQIRYNEPIEVSSKKNQLKLILSIQTNIPTEYKKKLKYAEELKPRIFFISFRISDTYSD